MRGILYSLIIGWMLTGCGSTITQPSPLDYKKEKVSENNHKVKERIVYRTRKERVPDNLLVTTKVPEPPNQEEFLKLNDKERLGSLTIYTGELIQYSKTLLKQITLIKKWNKKEIPSKGT